MSEDLKVYNLAAGGVQLVKEELQLANEELRQGQNVVFGVNDQGADLETRPGMSRFNTEAMSGAVIGFANVPLADLRSGLGSVVLLPDIVLESANPGSTCSGDEADDLAAGVDDCLFYFFPGTDQLVVTLTPVTADPGIDTGHKLLLRFYVSGAGPGQYAGGSISVGLYVDGGGGTVALYSIPQVVWQQNTWVTYEVDIPEADVATWRGLGGYAAPAAVVAFVEGNPDNFIIGLSQFSLTIPVT